MYLPSFDRCRDWGLLVLRVGIGLMFMAHGLPKVMGGAPLWTQLGGALPIGGPPVVHTILGFLAAMSEFGGGLMLALGLFTRLAAFFLFFTMAVAVSFHMRKGDDFNAYSHAAEACILFFSLIWIGPGKYSLDAILGKYNPLLRKTGTG